MKIVGMIAAERSLGPNVRAPFLGLASVVFPRLTGWA